MSERYGKIEEGKTYEEKEIEWKVMDISSLINCGKVVYVSPSFSFAGNSWHLWLYPKSAIKNGFMCLYLFKENFTDYSVEYTYGLKKPDGSVEHLGGGFFKEGDPKFSEPGHFIKLSQLQKRKSELTHSDVLTLTCKLMRGISDTQQTSVLDKPKLKKLIKLDVLSENFRSIFANKETCDTTMNVKGKEYKAHKTVLMARSLVFAAMFLHDTAEKETGIITIPDCDPESFEEFLEYLYCGKLENLSSSSALHLYETSDKYDIQELKEFCTECLMETFTVENLCDVVIMADKYDDTKLFSAAQCFFNRNLNKILVTSEWDCLLKNNHRLANKLMIEMSSKIKIVD